jgi:hypothetical protein
MIDFSFCCLIDEAYDELWADILDFSNESLGSKVTDGSESLVDDDFGGSGRRPSWQMIHFRLSNKLCSYSQYSQRHFVWSIFVGFGSESVKGFFGEISGILGVVKYCREMHSSQRVLLDGSCVLQKGVLHWNIGVDSSRIGFVISTFGFCFSTWIHVPCPHTSHISLKLEFL